VCVLSIRVGSNTMGIKDNLVKLGATNPGLRPHIRPLLKESAMDLVAEPRYRDYVRRFKGPGSPMKKEDWEAKVFGKPEGNEAPKSKKNWAPKVKEVMDKHGLADADADEVKAFKADKPSSGSKLSPQQLMQRFLQKAKPETRERMEGVTPGDFMKMLGAIMDEDEGGKVASFNMYASLVQLGVTNPELRPHIRSILAGCEKLPEGGMRDNCEKKQEEGDGKKEASRSKSAAFVNRLPMSYRMWADRVIGVLNKNGDPGDLRDLSFSFCVYLLSVTHPDLAVRVDRILAPFRHKPVLDDVGDM